MSSKKYYTNCIYGNMSSDSSIRNYFEDINPSTGETLGLFPESTKQTIDTAVRAARLTFPKWRALSTIKRAEYLNNLAQLIKAKKQELEILVTTDCGKPLNEGSADVVETLHMIQYAVGEAGMPCGTVISSEIAQKMVFMMRKPIGVMAVITPWNFPAAIPLWLIAPSLLHGNTVVWKPSEETPLVANRIMELFNEAGIPEGVINLVQGGKETGKELATHKDIDRVLFTGSADAAEWITRKQAELYPHRLPPVCEKGGKNALIVLEDADMELAVNAAVLSAFRTSGQRCVSAGRMIVHRNRIDEFSERFVEKVKRIKVGDPLNPEVFMGPLINRAGFEKVSRFNNEVRRIVNSKENDNFEILFDGFNEIVLSPSVTLPISSEMLKRLNYIFPFVYRVKKYWSYSQNFVLKEEAFGPHVAIISCSNIEEAVSIYNDTEYGLSCAVITEDYRKFNYCLKHCDAGLFYHNLPTIGAESRIQLPFGGVKKSGTGMPSAGYLVDAVTHKVAVTINNDTEITLAQGLSAKV